ncbi:hypothetical protein F4776DRAFT_663433 [Hypoxylon sp. NC0597]|nr:hypothetical protein F4776DRAFT_663433 [Hypoxylon sp. NC0597]
MSGVGEALAAPSAIAGLLSLGIEVAKALYAVADGHRHGRRRSARSHLGSEPVHPDEGVNPRRPQAPGAGRSQHYGHYRTSHPCLPALSIDQRASTTQNDSYVQNVQVRVILENSAASVESQHRRDRRERLHYTIEQQLQALLSAFVRYKSPSADEEDLSSEEIGDIDREVEEALDIGLESVADGDIEEIVLETYSVENAVHAPRVQQILAT